MTTILRYKKLRTIFLLQQSNENLMSAWKYLSVKTRIMQKPKSVNWFTLPISWLVSIWHAFLLNGISQQTIKTFRYKQNLLLCPKKSINNEGDRHLWKSHFTPYSCFSWYAIITRLAKWILKGDHGISKSIIGHHGRPTRKIFEF